jgi:glycosyltransferase involved in cell wall biosynthesis
MSTISVIMTVYNGEKFLYEAIESILNQTYKEFELLIIDDGSKDGSVEIVKSFTDSRIKLLVNEINRGQSYSRNWGIRESKGSYIAIMDADDVMYPNRLERQMSYLKQTNASICFSWADIIEENGKRVKLKSQISDPLLISAKLIFECPLVHPTAMWVKSKFIEKNLWYDEEYTYAQDMELWNRVKRYFKIFVIDETLIKFRFANRNSISFQKTEFQNKFALKISSRELKNLGYFGESPLEIEYVFNRIVAIRKIYKKFVAKFGNNDNVIKYFRNLLFPNDFKFNFYRIDKAIKYFLVN